MPPSQHQQAYEPTVDNLVRLLEEAEIVDPRGDEGRLFIEYSAANHRLAVMLDVASADPNVNPLSLRAKLSHCSKTEHDPLGLEIREVVPARRRF